MTCCFPALIRLTVIEVRALVGQLLGLLELLGVEDANAIEIVERDLNVLATAIHDEDGGGGEERRSSWIWMEQSARLEALCR
jgi:hypothetical protein